MSQETQKHTVAFVLTGGGARSAYHLGVLKYVLTEMEQELKAPIFVGSSAGAINSFYLVQKAHEGFDKAIINLCDLWSSLKIEKIYKTDVLSISRILWHFVRNFTVGRFAKKRVIESLLDTTPLSHLLISVADMKAFHNNIEMGLVKGVGITATQYGTGRSITFFEAKDQEAYEWWYPRRQGIKTHLTLKHVLASAAIPLLFPSVKVGEHYYGDGSIRFTAPLSPAIHLGANKICAVGLRKTDPVEIKPSMDYPSIAQIGGTLLNAIFLDTLDYDTHTLKKINKLLSVSGKQVEDYIPIDLCLIQPSMDLGLIALEYEKYVPKTLKFLMKSLSSTKRGGADLLSYLLFDGHYIQRLIELGFNDAKSNHQELLVLFK